MPVTINKQPNDIYVIQITGQLRRAEWSSVQEDIAGQIDTGSKPRVLAIVEDFKGWEKGVNWDDFDFLVKYSGEIARIAVVAPREWETRALGFAGAGVREAPVKFFTPTQIDDARHWLA